MTSRHILIAATGLALIGTVNSARAQDEEEKKGWETTASASLTMTRGNSHTMLGVVGLEAKNSWDKEEVSMGVAAGYGRNKDQSTGVDSRTTDFAKAYLQYNHLMTERFYLGLRLDGEHDGIADLTYRFRIAPLAGYYVIKNEKTSLAFEAGPSLIIERYDTTTSNPNPTTDTHLAVRFAERFEHKISDDTKVWQSAEYTPFVKDWADHYLINGEVGISTAITEKWDLRVVLQAQHDSNPPVGKDYTDYRLLAGTGYKF